MGEIMQGISYIKDKSLVIYTFLLGIITYSVKLFSFSYGMDTLNFITLKDAYLMHWIQIGRPGMYFFKKYIIGQYMNIFIANLCFVVFICITSLIICNMIYSKLGYKQNNQLSGRLRLFIIPSLFVTTPLFVQQAYFVLQNIEFSFSLLLVTLAALPVAWGKNRKLVFRSLIILSLFVAFSCYQSFPIYYIGLLIFLAFLDVHKGWENNVKVTLVTLFKRYIDPIFDMILAFICYEILEKVMLYAFQLKSSSYLKSQISWGKEQVGTILNTMISSMRDTLVVGFNYSFNIDLLLGLIGIIIIWVTQYVAKRRNVFVFFVLAVGLVLDVFFFNIFLGQSPAPRALVPSYYLIVAIVFFICSLYIRKHYLLILLEILVFLIGSKQLILATNLMQADYIRYNQDLTLINRIETRIDAMRINPAETKLMIVGYHNHTTPLNIQSDLVGESMFEFGDFTGNTSAMTENIVFLMNQGGYDIQAVNNEEFNKEFYRSSEMGIFPQKNSVKKYNNIIIVKLSGNMN